jgi:hypothetical protein
MNLEDFVRLVADMRAAQKRYFRDRDSSDLKESKRLEKLVDSAIRNGVIPSGSGYCQSDLFSDRTSSTN